MCSSDLLGMMGLIGVCLLIVGYIGKKDREKKAKEDKNKIGRASCRERV